MFVHCTCPCPSSSVLVSRPVYRMRLLSCYSFGFWVPWSIEAMPVLLCLTTSTARRAHVKTQAHSNASASAYIQATYAARDKALYPVYLIVFRSERVWVPCASEGIKDLTACDVLHGDTIPDRELLILVIAMLSSHAASARLCPPICLPADPSRASSVRPSSKLFRRCRLWRVWE